MTNLKHLRFEIVVSIDLGDYLVCSEVTLAKSGSSFIVQICGRSSKAIGGSAVELLSATLSTLR